MFPDLTSIQVEGFSEPVALHTYGMMLLLAFGAACAVAHGRIRKVGTNPDLLLPILGWAILLGIFGARLLHFLGAEPGVLLTDPLVLFKLNQGGMAFYGGVIAATIGCLVVAKRKGEHVWKFADAIAPTVLIGLAVGRLGCFAAGCCHGRTWDPGEVSTLWELPGGSVLLGSGFPWLALQFKAGVGVGNIHGVPLYPSQLWEAGGALLVFGFLSWIWIYRRRFDGQVLGWLLICYPLLRASLETFRGDTLRGVSHFGLFSTSQLVSIPVALGGIAILIVRRKHGLAPEAPWEPPEDDLLLDLEDPDY
jgi:phosphatidylglycerol:prolipoprotein diacylglycerol transferase